MSLRDAAVAASATASDQATQAAKARTRATAAEIAETIKAYFVDDVEVVWKRSATWDCPMVASERFSGDRIVHKSHLVHIFEVDDVTFGAVKDPNGGSSLDLYVVTECVECEGPTLASGQQSDHWPWGLGGLNVPYRSTRKDDTEYFETTAGPEFVRTIGHVLRTKVRCPACLLRLPKHCPTCDRRIRP